MDMPLLVGEWSLATDNCAMWLNGFNDNLPGYPKVQCSMVPCAGPYMGYDQPGCPPDATMPRQGPFGTGERHPALTLVPARACLSWRGAPLTCIIPPSVPAQASAAQIRAAAPSVCGGRLRTTR